MSGNNLILSEVIVVFSALIYWTGVVIHAHHIRKRTDRSRILVPAALGKISSGRDGLL